jgi:hypothetical protein
VPSTLSRDTEETLITNVISLLEAGGVVVAIAQMLQRCSLTFGGVGGFVTNPW